MNAPADRPTESEQAAAFHSLFVAHVGPLRRYASQLLRDDEQASDIVQDVFVRLWERRERWDAARVAAPYLYRAVRYGVYDLAKHQAVVQRHATGAQRAGREAGAEDLERDLSLAELRAAVALAVDALPAPQREVFVLSRHAGLTYAEIAESLGLSVKTVEKRMSAAFRALYVALAPYQGR